MANAIVEENGEVHFFRDVYGHDDSLLHALEDHSRRDQNKNPIQTMVARTARSTWRAVAAN